MTSEQSITPHQARSADWKPLSVFLLLFFFYAYLHQGPGWNQNSRLDLLHSIWADGSLSIDTYHFNTGDKSDYQGHFYSDKGPGIALLALPAFLISVFLVKMAGMAPDAVGAWDLVDWLTTLGSVGVITALGGMAFFCLIRDRIGNRGAFLGTMFVFLGSIAFPYATVLFSHGAVIGLLSIALWAIGPELGLRRAMEDRTNRGRMLLAGACCGLAMASEYTAALAAGGVLLLAFLHHWRSAFWLAIGSIPFLIIVMVYHWICFGSPTSLGYSHVTLQQFQDMKKGLFGITFPPKASAARLILFSEERGLFFWTPFFVASVLGVVTLFRSQRSLLFISLLVIVAQVICISGYYMPNGGAAMGPRLLAPLVPFIALLSLFGLAKFRWLVLPLGIYSVGLTGWAVHLNAMPPEHMPGVWAGFYVPLWNAASFQWTWLGQLGFKGYWPVVPFGVMLIALILQSMRYLLEPKGDAILRDPGSTSLPLTTAEENQKQS